MGDIKELLAAYREARAKLLSETFANGSVVRAKGTTSLEWVGVVRGMSAPDRRATSADMVFVEWVNGNRYPVPVDEIELKR